MPFSFCSTCATPLLRIPQNLQPFLVYPPSLSTCRFYTLLHTIPLRPPFGASCASLFWKAISAPTHVQTFKYWFLSTLQCVPLSFSHSFQSYFGWCWCCLFLYACCVCFIDHMLWKSRIFHRVCMCVLLFVLFPWHSIHTGLIFYRVFFFNISIGWKHFLSLYHLPGVGKKFKKEEKEESRNDRQSRIKRETREV